VIATQACGSSEGELMTVGPHDAKGKSPSLIAQGWISGAVVAVAAVMFVGIGSRLTLSLLGSTGSHRHPDPGLATAFILDIALLLLAWRRSVELKSAFAARDVAEQKAIELAWTDEATGLSNRRFLIERLGSLCSSGAKVALILLDLDKFKNINDLYGHAAGDALLKTVASRIESLCPGAACHARLGGDEFAIAVHGDSLSEQEVSALAERILAELMRPIELENTVVVTGASIGLSMTDQDCNQPSTLLRRSDIAMYAAKTQGRCSFAWFDPAMERDLNRKNELEAEIRSSIAAGRFIPYFQPTIDAGTGEIKGFEVLARWDHPERGILEPGEFIALAETTGLISDISVSVMGQALRIARHWPQHIHIAVNISPVQFKDQWLGERVLKVLAETGFPANRLELEVTESTLLADQRQALTTIESLKNQGIRISIDDFGTGYASLSQLRALPFDRIKIDKSFVASLLEDHQCKAIVHAIATLGKSLCVPITAEGVETNDIFEELYRLGCEDLQGWLFGKAVPADKAAQMLPRHGASAHGGATDDAEARAPIEAPSPAPRRRNRRA
jgi:diguanylate cyclase (GGDEF)-like protein